MHQIIKLSIVSLLVLCGQMFVNAELCEGDYDVRRFEEFKQLENCTVISGSLAIVFVFKIDELKEINELVLPVREISGFLMLHQVKYLKTMGSLLPNLTIIRGERLFSNYALVIYEMDDLENVSWPKKTSNLTKVIIMCHY